MTKVKVIDADTARLMRENSFLKRRNAELEADLEYVAMMTDVELPEAEPGDDEDEQEV